MTFYEIGKRIIDIIVSLVAITLMGPVMAFIAIYVKIVSPNGPVFADTPLRVTKGGKEFKMYKFRSMIPNAHQWMLDHPEFHQEYIKNNYKVETDSDPRLLPGASLIRKTSLDEFPQFFNVLQGTMSVVGPRAYYPFELKEQSERYPETREYVQKVISINPGITGPWQVSGRSAIGYKDRVRMDAEYADKRSLLYDLLIILKTPYAIVAGEKGSPAK
ncbi:MAG: undecaprenyl-phosphate galactose phosphotransferase [uncultured bacterium]|nr:MAG: undecaprenyl-phosphate galactose phosphotransferase [uncultured bacterium]